MEGLNNWSLSKQDTSVLKGLAIIAMLFHHLFCSIPSWVEPYYGALGRIGELGKVCVALFLFCSGYGLSTQFDKVKGIKGSCRYMVKRFVSFYFNYWVVFIVFVPVTVLLFNRPLSAAYGENVNLALEVAYDLLGMQGFSSYNITWWFNKLLLLLYLLFPLFYLGTQKSGVIVLLVSLLICRYWMTVVGYDYYGTLYVYQLPFVCGILWNKWGNGDTSCRPRIHDCHSNSCQELSHGTSYMLVLGAVLVLSVMIICRMYQIIPHWSKIRMDAFVVLGVVMLVVSLRRIGVSMRILAFFGKHSANIYLIHTFINVYWHLSWLHNGVVMRSGLNFLVLLLLSLLSSIILEWIKGTLGVYKLLNLIKIKLLS